LKGMIAKGWTLLSLLFIIGLVAGSDACSGGPLVIGAVEEILLFPGGIRTRARIDTGATTTSIDARNLKVGDGTASFTLPQSCGSQVMVLPIVDWKYIRTAAKREKRPVVEIELCIGTKKLKVRANLNDRSSMEYPILIGRNVLTQGFLVDASQTDILPPQCCDGRE
jgi:hypothetical protein